MWQEIIVGAIVLVAALSLLWRYVPRSWRQRAGKVHPVLAPAASGRCGGCSACGGDSCSDTRKPSSKA